MTVNKMQFVYFRILLQNQAEEAFALQKYRKPDFPFQCNIISYVKNGYKFNYRIML